MNSFLYQQSTNPIISPPNKSTNLPPSTLNPFYEFVNTIKPTLTPTTQPSNPSQISLPSSGLHPQSQSQRKNSQELSDPRKLLPILKSTTTNNPNTNPKKSTSDLSNDRNDRREKRSRSRQKNYLSQNTSNSQTHSHKQKQPDFYRKTKLCPLFEKGQCNRTSADCNFAHGFQQLKCYKTQLCYAYQKGQCGKPSQQCKYAHGKKELRPSNDGGQRQKQKYSPQNQETKTSDKYRKHNRDRDSQSTNRYDKNDRSDKRNNSRAKSPSKNSKKQKIEVHHDPLSYKKNLPLTKDYEKFLYGDSNPKGSSVQNSMYMISNGPANPPKASYSMEAYSINLGQNFGQYQRPSVSLNYPQNVQPYKHLLQEKEILRQPSVSYFERSSRESHMQFYPNPNQTQIFLQKSYYHEKPYPERSHQGYNKVEYVGPSYRTPSTDFSQDFSKNFYKQSNQGGFNEQPFTNGSKTIENFADSSYRRPSGYNQFSNQAGRPEDFYRNDPFYSGQNRKNEFDSMAAVRGGNQNFSGYRNDFQGNGGYNRYPPTDNANYVGKDKPTYPGRSYNDKGSYQNFSNKKYK